MSSPYDIPSNDRYLKKFESGDTTIRFLLPPLDGYRRWVEVTDENGKAVKKPITVKRDANLQVEFAEDYSFCWLCWIWNYNTNSPQILVTEKSTIIRPLATLAKSDRWGELTKYDVTINKTGEGFNNTRYTVTPNPITPLTSEMKKRLKGINVNLENLYSTEEEPYGGDPFSEAVVDNDEVEKALNESN